MSKFSDKIKMATKLAASQLPTIDVFGECFRVKKVGMLSILEQEATAMRLLKIRSNEEPTATLINITRAFVAMGKCLVDEEGNHAITDDEDMLVWLDYIGENMAVNTEMSEKTGIKTALETNESTNDGPKMTPMEIAEGN